MSIAEQLGAILKRWQERLIDVSKSNPLLGLNRSRTAKLEIETADLDKVAKSVLSGDGSIKLPFIQKKAKRNLELGEDVASEKQEEEYILNEGDVNFIYQNIGDLRRKIRKISENSRLTLSERGVNTLYLAIGCLEWSDAMMGSSESPLIMIPCEFEYRGASKALGLVMADEDVILNPAIRYYLKEREEIDLPEIKSEEFDFDKIDSFLESITKLVKHNDWKVTKRAWLGIFSFESLAIYQDLKMLDGQAKTNALVQAIAHLGGEAIENVHLDDELDAMQTPQQIPIPVVQADSSQLKAMTLVAQGANVVIHGPPGTGKSQTITGIIADALGQKKKVLFVSSKMAALNVVHNRLQAIGLGQYCLEAHGVKSGKRKVIDELKRSIEINEDIKVAKNFNEDFAKMIESRNALNDYVKTLHSTKNELAISVFNAYGNFETLSEAPLIKAPLPWSNVLEVSQKDLDRAEDLLREVRDNSVLFSKRNSHPLKGMKSGGIDLSTQERLEYHLLTLISFCEAISNELKKLSNLFKSVDLPFAELFSAMETFEQLSKLDQLPMDWFKKSINELNSAREKVLECQNAFQKKESSLAKFRSFSSGSPVEVLRTIKKLQEKYPNWYSRISPQYFEDKKGCLSCVDKLKKLNGSLLNEIATSIEEFLISDKKFNEEIEALSLAELKISEDVFTSLQYIQQKHETAIVFKNWLEKEKISLVERPIFTGESSNIFSGLVDILKSSKQNIADVQADLGTYWPDGLLAKTKIDADLLTSIEASARTVKEGLNQQEARNWQTISRIKDRCENSAMMPFVDFLDEAGLLKAPEIFRKRFYSIWIDAMLHSSPVLNEFSGSSHADLISKYKVLDEKIMRLNILNIIAVPAQDAKEVKNAKMGVGSTNGVGILRKEMEKKKGLKPLRILFNEIPQVLQALKPCFLMSPLSVSTFLKPGAFNFDLVIFDEASQLPTPEAIPSILRAKQVVVAGDSNQLPPSSFFRTSITGDSNEWEEGQIEELESLLDDCKASVPFFQETDLKWHYRSRDERLINFSNHYYYENRLITFPSPCVGSNKSGVVLEYVPDGVWDRGGSRINRKEARRVAKLIIEQLKSEPEKSLGVVALNSSQKEAIDEALEEEMQSHKDLAPLVDSEKADALFIKSLENVQGDERDVIIISVGYGKAQDGKMSLNFGPLNTEGGWRRLNVLVTRAKWKTILVTSIRASELVGINPESKGPIGLKNYIQYAETGFLNESREAAHVLAEETNDFEDSVRRELELRGFKVDAQVGVGSFKIDLAVRDPKNPTGYAIGVECDGAAYHSSRSARDRDILRQEILQCMGWKLCRVWSTEWFKNKEATTRLLIENVTRAVNGKSIIDAEFAQNVETPVEEAETLKSVPQKKSDSGNSYIKSVVRCKRETIMDSKKVYQFSDILTSIVNDEGPIHVDLVLERVKTLANVARIGANIQANFKAAIKLAIRDGGIEKSEDDKDFLFKSGKHYSTFRIPSDGVERRLDQISKVEISNAVNFLIKDQFGLAYDNAVQSIKHLFGISRVDPEESDRVKDLIDGMIASGLIVKHGPLLNLAVQTLK